MPTPSSGPISMADINANFGRGTDLNSYRNTIWYQPASLNFGYFNSGTIDPLIIQKYLDRAKIIHNSI